MSEGEPGEAHVSAIDAIVAANRALAANFVAAAAGTPRVALVLCMDARMDPVRMLGIRPGHAHIIRNAGGRLVEAVRSLVVSQQIVGTEEVAIIHHTECGMQTFSAGELRARLIERFGDGAGEMEFHEFGDLQESVLSDIALYRRMPFLRQDIPVRGFVYEVATGRLREVSDGSGGP